MQTAEGHFPMETTYTWKSLTKNTKMDYAKHWKTGRLFNMVCTIYAIHGMHSLFPEFFQIVISTKTVFSYSITGVVTGNGIECRSYSLLSGCWLKSTTKARVGEGRLFLTNH